MKPFVAKHPTTGKWWAIDRVLKMPVGQECETKKQAEKEWFKYMQSMHGDITTRKLDI